MNARALFPVGRRLRLLRRPSEPILPAAPRPVRRDCQGRLVAALIGQLEAGDDVVAETLTPWASATFIGARHGLTLVLRGEDAAARARELATQLPEAQFALPGHLVADLVVDAITEEAGEVRLLLSVLTIEVW